MPRELNLPLQPCLKIPREGRVLALLLLAAPALAQPAPDSTAHRVPFAATGNTLELAVVNPSEAVLGGVTVALVDRPAWLAVTPEAVTLDALEAGEEAVAAFAFDVDPAAPVGEPGAVTLEVRDAGGAVLAVKAVRLAVEAPRAVALHPAYPNPAGVSGGGRATVAFDLPEAARVSLSVYDVLGRRVAVLVDGERAPGRHEAAFETRGVASGLYVARLVVECEGGTREAKTQRLTVVR